MLDFYSVIFIFRGLLIACNEFKFYTLSLITRSFLIVRVSLNLTRLLDVSFLRLFCHANSDFRFCAVFDCMQWGCCRLVCNSGGDFRVCAVYDYMKWVFLEWFVMQIVTNDFARYLSVCSEVCWGWLVMQVVTFDFARY